MSQSKKRNDKRRAMKKMKPSNIEEMTTKEMIIDFMGLIIKIIIFFIFVSIVIALLMIFTKWLLS